MQMQMQWGQHRSEVQGWMLRWCLWLLSVAVVASARLFLLEVLVRVQMLGLHMVKLVNVWSIDSGR